MATQPRTSINVIPASVGLNGVAFPVSDGRSLAGGEGEEEEDDTLGNTL
jgi:hypothetical protein